MQLLYADDLARCDETIKGVLAKYHKWKAAMERKGLKVNVKKTKGMTTNDGSSLPTAAAIAYPACVEYTRDAPKYGEV